MYWVVFKGAAREVYSRLMDSADPALVDTAETALRDAEGVLHVGQVRMRWISHALRAEADIAVDPHLTVVQAHGLAVQLSTPSSTPWHGWPPPPSTPITCITCITCCTAPTRIRPWPWPWPWPTVAPAPSGPAATAARRCPGIRDRAYSNAFHEQGRPHETGMRCTRSPAGS